MAILLAVLSVVSALVPVLVQVWSDKRDKQNKLASVEANELAAGMDRVDKLFPPEP